MSLKDYAEEHEVLQTCVDVVMEQRDANGLSSDGIAKIAFYTFFLWLLPKIGIISQDSAFMLRSVYILYIKNTTGIDCFSIVSHLFKWFSAAEEDAPKQDTNEVLLALFSVSMLICEQDGDRAVKDYEVSLDALHDVLSVLGEN